MQSTEEKMDIPLAGSLGLLAYGAKGLKAWRAKKKEEKAKGESEGK